MHLCDVNDLFSPRGGGVRTYQERKLDYFERRGDVRYTLVVPAARESRERRGSVQVVRLPGVPVPGVPHYRVLLGARRLRAVLAELGPDAVEVGGCYLTPWIARAAARGLPTVLTGFWHTDFPRAFVERPLARLHPALGRLGLRLGWCYARASHRAYATTFGASDVVCEELERRGIRPVVHNPLGVDLATFSPRRRSERLRASVGAGPDVPLVLFPHRLLDEKGLSTLLEAFPRIHARRRCVLVLLGTGPGLSRLRVWMRGREDVAYAGYVEQPAEVARWMASSDLVLALSPYETFGLAIAEALASGVPVLGADEGAAAEHLARSGAGTVVRPYDPEALERSTVELLERDDLAALGVRGRAYAERELSWDRAFDGMLAEYARLTGAGAPPSPLRSVDRGQVRSPLSRTACGTIESADPG